MEGDIAIRMDAQETLRQIGGSVMSERLPQRANQSYEHGECFECEQRLSSRVLWAVGVERDGEMTLALQCFACLAATVLRDLAQGLDATPPTPEVRPTQCDRCKRRSRPTTEHHGFNVCSE